MAPNAAKATIAAAITACPAGGTVFIGAGVHTFTTLTISKNITLAGVGWSDTSQLPFAHASWSSPQTFRTGTILVSTATTGAGINIDATPWNVCLRDFQLLGPGSGTSSGIKITAGHLIASVWSNIRVGNFALGFDFYNTEDNTFIALNSMGNKTGFSLTVATNQNVFIGPIVQFSSIDSILINGGDVNRFVGGLLQNVGGNTGIRIATGDQNIFESFYCETSGAGGTLTKWIDLTSGSGARFADFHFSTAEAISISAPYTTLENFRGTNTITLNAGAGGSRLLHMQAATIVDNSTGKASIWDPDGVIPLFIKGGLRLSSGVKMYVETTGTNSYFGRNGSTGDTEIGTATGVVAIPVATTTTVAPSAGAAGALPATPAGYVSISLNGTVRKLPYY